MQNKGGVEEKGLESKAGFCPTELDVSFFKLGFGKVFKWKQSQGLWWKGVCAVYPACESPDHVGIVLGEVIELENAENNEIVIGDF